MRYLYLLLIFTVFTLKSSLAQIRQLPWERNAVIYEINTRQYSPRGTFNDVIMTLPRLKNLGVDILWMMPIHPIGALKRKGPLGDPYSVKNYRQIDSSYGDTTSFHRLIRRAHGMGMKVIIDWVANQTAWDHPWVRQHPDWYVQNDKGEIQSPANRSDVAKLNFAKREMRAAMIEDMKYWVREFDIDGFRCDLAYLVPVDFWNEVRTELDKIKPMFMLAEMEWNTAITDAPAEYFKKAFNASYGWTFMNVTEDMSRGKKTLTDFRNEMVLNYARFPQSMLKMFFVTNQDENSRNGTVIEKYGDNWQLFATLCYTLPQSLPLIYTGEESGMNRRLKLFEKDPVLPREWADTSKYDWYRTMIKLKHENSALWNIGGAGNFQEITVTSADTAVHNKIYAFRRVKGNNEVAVLTNFSPTDVVINFPEWQPNPSLKQLFNNDALVKNKSGKWVLKAYSNVVLYK